MIVLQVCRDRLPCASVGLHEGRPAHIDGLTFTSEAAAQRFHRTQLVGPLAVTWQTFPTWQAAWAWVVQD